MARTKREAGTTLDRRNGRRAELPAEGTLRKFSLPRDREWQPETPRMWRAIWSDNVARAWTPGDRPILEMLADAYDRRVRALRDADADPIVPGSMNQPAENPLYAVAAAQYPVVRDCLAQLGLGALNRSRLGYIMVSERLTLQELNRRYMDEPGAIEPDPRIVEDFGE